MTDTLTLNPVDETFRLGITTLRDLQWRAVATYPTRYAAWEVPHVWAVQADPAHHEPGREWAVYASTSPYAHGGHDASEGVYVEIWQTRTGTRRRPTVRYLVRADADTPAGLARLNQFYPTFADALTAAQAFVAAHEPRFVGAR